jgi:starvation-inducible DNA-binding protein
MKFKAPENSGAFFRNPVTLIPQNMFAELRDDNFRLASTMRQVHNTCDEYNGIATASLLEIWIDETDYRSWFLYEASRCS